MALDDSDLSDLSDTYDDVEEDELDGEDAVMQPSSEEDQPGDNEDDDDDEDMIGYDDDGSSVGESGFDAIGDIAADVKGKGKATSYNVDYSVLSRVDLAREMKKEIDHVASALSQGQGSCSSPTIPQVEQGEGH